MDNVILDMDHAIGENFIPAEYLPKGRDEYYLRNSQNPVSHKKWRNLRSKEIEILVANGNSAENWNNVQVSAQFDPTLIRHSSFYGLVRIGRLQKAVLRHHDLALPTGIYNSLIISSDIGDDCAIHNVHYLSHYLIGQRCILADIDEMNTTNHAKFGNGILKDGEAEKDRVWIDIMNETGSRQVLPFDGMSTADAYLWAKYRDDHTLQSRLKEMTEERFDTSRGYYGSVAEQCVIKTSRILKDVKVGAHAYIKGANKLKNLTINSSAEEPSQIGEGVELVNGIIGYGCHIFYGCKAVRFILGNKSNLKYGARLINSFLGSNSTISCCEVLNNLIFPAHEQHHNNSFLIASVVMGQSNMAAGATVGSNHNSRANDNEVVAGRGFWPGLSSSLKHSSRFASFTLLAKGAYPAELNIPLPFSLLNNNEAEGGLEVMPAFWWMYNMYALARNSWKFHHRDKRIQKNQHIEFDYLAPDTAEEIREAMRLLSIWTGKALRRIEGHDPAQEPESALSELGRKALADAAPLPAGIEVLGEGMEKSRRKVKLIKVQKAYQSYRDMLIYYGVKNLLKWREDNRNSGLKEMLQALSGERQTEWINLGGQLVRCRDVDQLREDIKRKKLSSWEEIHQRYDQLWEEYPREKQKHALATLQWAYSGENEMSEEAWESALDEAARIQEYIRDQVYATRKKDYENPFRKATYRSDAEMQAAIGSVEDNSFIKLVKQETEEFISRIEKVRQY